MPRLSLACARIHVLADNDVRKYHYNSVSTQASLCIDWQVAVLNMMTHVEMVRCAPLLQNTGSLGPIEVLTDSPSMDMAWHHILGSVHKLDWHLSGMLSGHCLTSVMESQKHLSLIMNLCGHHPFQ